MATRFPRTIILSVQINCCEECPRKLKKELLKIDGVDSVVVDPAELLVCVIGKIDAAVLVKAINKMGKRAEILSSEKESDSNGKKHKSSNIPRTGIGKKNKEKECDDESCYDDGDSDSSSSSPSPVKEGFVHKHQTAADYVPPHFDESVCRDPFCMDHRGRQWISQRIPPHHRHHQHTGGGFFCGGGNFFHDYYHYHHRRHRSRGFVFYRNHDRRGCTIM